jgi:hypothetical protein
MPKIGERPPLARGTLISLGETMRPNGSRRGMRSTASRATRA